MDPVSALIIACVISWCAARAAVEAAVDQAKAEARTAASAIRDDLRGRGEAWAKRVADRLADGRKGGPSTALWWGWAAARTARALRKAMQREPRTAERLRALRRTAGPFRRIWDAGKRGARYAWDEAHRQRDTQEQQTRVPVGVCGRCGAVVARAALVWALTRSGTQEQMCAQCRADVAAERQTDEESHRKPEPRPDPDVPDAHVVDDQPQINRPRPELDVPSPDPSEPATAPEPPLDAPEGDRELDPPGTRPAPVEGRDVNPHVNPPVIQGEPMPPRQPGQIVPRRTPTPTVRTSAPAVRTSGGAVRTHGGSGGESYTHGQWNRAVVDINKRLEQLPAFLEAMLQRLTTADAGRTQVHGVLATRDEIVAFMEQVRAMLHDVNRREQPLLTAVQAAGGPEEIAGIPYFRDV